MVEGVRAAARSRRLPVGATWSVRPEDVLLAVASAVLALLSMAGRLLPIGEAEDQGNAGFRTADGLGIGLVVLGSAGILTMTRWPLLSLLVVDGCMFGLHALGYIPPPLPAAELVVLYTIASTLRTVVSAAAAAITALSIVVADLLHDTSLDDDKLIAFLLAVLLAWVVGYVVRVSRTQTLTAEENVRLLAAQQEVQTMIAVREEKERLTRELHDIVGHGVGVMVALAAAGRVSGRQGHGDHEQALAAIEGTGRAAIAEMRALIRDRDGEEAPEVPLFTESALNALLDRTRAAGLEVDLTVEGAPQPLPSSVDRAAFRLVQESLTNTLRHAGATHAQVRIGYRPDAVDIRVRDDGHGQHPRRRAEDRVHGRGHVGMRQRVVLLGGDLDARETVDGYEVVATIPLGQQP